MFGLFKTKRKPLIPEDGQKRIVEAIQQAEHSTSGEVRVFVESRCNYVNAMDKAKEVFFNLKMDQTEEHNAVLIYVAVVDRQMALFGDVGIYQKTGGDPYWLHELNIMRQYFRQGEIAEGIASCAINIGKALSQHFPYDKTTDKNELPDDIVFGK
jgi:uncharacterized membrane protein